ncbi:hypothetical protein BZA05DRAFT_453487 [Tricharina praecox]|uniref:uncharacterized protein n=1 Tax=Tricharina praecox TaxID=43433 RepID=UPI00221F283D|nr:uncharacterized protein BZA05DRAFT_453487 [Tricharina praecox]KAI5850934.1 hypothetical protein BZA05DRAFT_453487 [Tricharina praecox]
MANEDKPTKRKAVRRIVAHTIIAVDSRLDTAVGETDGDHPERPRYPNPHTTLSNPLDELLQSHRNHHLHDTLVPLFVENDYTCDFPSRSRSVGTDDDSQKPLAVPAPYSHIAGKRGADGMVVSREAVGPAEESFQRLLQAEQKITVASHGCDLLPSSALLDWDYSTGLFWKIRELTN